MKTGISRVGRGWFHGILVPMMLHGCNTWEARARDINIKRILVAAQRPFLTSINRRYRTASNRELQNFGRVPP